MRCGARRHVGQEHGVVGAERVVVEVVLDRPQGVEAELVGQLAEPDLLGDDLAVGDVLVVAPRLEDHLHAELHREHLRNRIWTSVPECWAHVQVAGTVAIMLCGRDDDRTGLRPHGALNRRVADGMLATNDAAVGLSTLLGMRLDHFEPGYLRASLDVRPELLTPIGNLHGGAMAALVDHVLGCVLYPHMGRGQWAATTEFKLNYLNPVTDGILVAEARILNMTRRSAVVRIDVAER